MVVPNPNTTAAVGVGLTIGAGYVAKHLGWITPEDAERRLRALRASKDDAKAVAASLGADLATGGYFCNGEIGPIGIKGLTQADGAVPTFLHGFTSVVALMYAKDV